jgi:hypothetical protein
MNTEQLTLQRYNRVLVCIQTKKKKGSRTVVLSMYSHVLVLTPQDQGRNQSLLLLGGAGVEKGTRV